MDKIKCIFCEKDFDDDKVKGFGDEHSCEPCFDDIMSQVEKNGIEKEIPIPRYIIDQGGFLDFIEENFEWLEERLGQTPFAWKLISFDEESEIAKVKFI